MHFDADDPVGLVVVEDDAGGSCLKRDLWDSGIDGIAVRNCDLTPGFAVRACFENDVLERFRVGEALGGVEDFDAGEAVVGVVVEGGLVRNLLCRRRHRIFKGTRHRPNSVYQLVYQRAIISSGAVNFRLAMYVEVVRTCACKAGFPGLPRPMVGSNVWTTERGKYGAYLPKRQGQRG